MARHGVRTRPPGGDPRAADGDDEEDTDGDGRRIPSVPIPHHTYMLPARVLAPCSPPRPCDGSFAHKRAGPVVSATSWSSKLSTPRSHPHRFCIAIAPFSIQAGPWILATQPARNARARRDLCPSLYVAAIAYPRPPRTHAPRPHTQTGPSFFSPCGAPLPPSLLLAHNLLVPRVH